MEKKCSKPSRQAFKPILPNGQYPTEITHFKKGLPLNLEEKARKGLFSLAKILHIRTKMLICWWNRKRSRGRLWSLCRLLRFAHFPWSSKAPWVVELPHQTRLGVYWYLYLYFSFLLVSVYLYFKSSRPPWSADLLRGYGTRSPFCFYEVPSKMVGHWVTGYGRWTISPVVLVQWVVAHVKLMLMTFSRHVILTPTHY